MDKIEKKLDELAKKQEDLNERVNDFERNFISISSDVQSSVEALSTLLNKLVLINQNPENSQKVVNKTPGVKGDGEMSDSTVNANIPQGEKPIYTLNIKEFFKHMFANDENFRKEFFKEDGEKGYEAYLETPAGKKNKPDMLPKKRADYHYKFQDDQAKKRIKEIKNNMKNEDELKKRTDSPNMETVDF